MVTSVKYICVREFPSHAVENAGTDRGVIWDEAKEECNPLALSLKT